MSFDWLNIPGLTIPDSLRDQNVEEGVAPPSVSFRFTDDLSQNQSQDSRSEDMNKIESGMRKHDMSAINGLDSHGNLINDKNTIASYEPQAKSNPFRKDDESTTTNEYKETPEDLHVPLSLSQNQLTHEEVRTYIRWYNYITLRTNGKLVRLRDVFRFLSNFNISEALKERISAIFRSCKNALNIGQFFAVIRLLAKAMVEGILPQRRMILEKTPVPKPRSILNNDKVSEEYVEIEDDRVPEPSNGSSAGSTGQVDFDSFASLLLTGKTNKRRIRRVVKKSVHKTKKVRFSENIAFQDASIESKGVPSEEIMDDDGDSQRPLDLSLPMNQLLQQIAKRKESSGLVFSPPSEQLQTQEEKEELADMEDSLSHFKQIQTGDSVGLSSLPSQISTNHPVAAMGNNNLSSILPLKPTATGSANHFFRPSEAGDNANDGMIQHHLKPTATGSANYYARESLGSGEVVRNNYELQPLKPTATGSANYLVRNHISAPGPERFIAQPLLSSSGTAAQSVLNVDSQPLKPTATGSANYLMKTQLNTGHGFGHSSPSQNDLYDTSNQTVINPDMNNSKIQFENAGHVIPQPAPQHYVHTNQLYQSELPSNSGLDTRADTHKNRISPSPDFLSPQNAAGNYFQSLLSSNSPKTFNSANSGQMDINPNNSEMAMPQNNSTQSSGSNTQEYRTNRNLYLQVPGNYSHPNQGPQYQSHTTTSISHSNNHVTHSANQFGNQYLQANNIGNMIGQPNYTPPNSQSSQGILSNLQSLQQQVDALHQAYNGQ